ncbi:hypothetical protein [Thermodesulfovibrio yellowstonii]|uniref:hypothetical protein n=1 Tax=Thermodesulfovibrio yellowstonii TaxID=28262 RepID=UPI0024B32EBD|nr:hypothetical protein [Thermodesulfovibrio yellowstonii]MDI6865761.1 hypothetical protein [Thermodesulfovibrio yellowstonii]
MKYKVKLSYPTALELNGRTYLLFQGAEIELPEAEIVKTYLGLGYLEPAYQEESKDSKVNKDKGDKK